MIRIGLLRHLDYHSTLIATTAIVPQTPDPSSRPSLCKLLSPHYQSAGVSPGARQKPEPQTVVDLLINIYGTTIHLCRDCKSRKTLVKEDQKVKVAPLESTSKARCAASEPKWCTLGFTDSHLFYLHTQMLHKGTQRDLWASVCSWKLNTSIDFELQI